MTSLNNIKEMIRTEAYRLGFVLCGFSTAQTPYHYEHYLRWLEAGCHADMAFMTQPNAISARENPETLLHGCQTVISLAMAYSPPTQTSIEQNGNLTGRIAAYAVYSDYHAVMTSSLKTLVNRLGILSEGKTFVAVDTAPVLEKEFAVSAGLGMIGRNSLVINPKFGSWLLLGEILTTIRIEPDLLSVTVDCQDCHRCEMACPTKAIRPDRSIDARRCLSYLTIENRGSIPEIFRETMGNRIFGCDACQSACPYNRDLVSLPSPAFSRPTIDSSQNLVEVFRWTEADFNSRFANTPVLRCKYQGWRRNVAIALGNTKDQRAILELEEALIYEKNLVVREAIEWGLHRLVKAS